MNSIQNYQDVERQYRAKQKSRMERQFKIGKLASVLDCPEARC